MINEPHSTMSGKNKRLLNIGCGGHFHEDWVNVDIGPISPQVIDCDILAGLPFPAATFEAIYSSHVLEHLTPQEGLDLLTDSCRLLAQGGVCRVVVPDTETQVKSYQDALAGAKLNDLESEGAYDWAVLELFEQMVRTQPGGDMLRYLLAPEMPAEKFVANRIGAGDLANWRSLVAAGFTPPPPLLETVFPSAGPLSRRLMGKLSRWLLTRLAGKAVIPALEEALFRQSGECHRWIYDHFGLHRAMLRAGFRTIYRQTATTSLIPDFSRYGLDIVNGQERRPNSVYLEGVI
jgi:hypothetical protein